MKELDIPKSGKLGKTVSYQNRYGQISRQYVVPRDPRTSAQINRRAAFGQARLLWRTLAEEQQLAWNLSASGKRTRTRLNQSGRLSGYLLFIQINCNLAAIGLAMVLEPPDVPKFEINPVGQLLITNTNGVIRLKLKVSGALAQYTVVSGSKPRSAGVTYVDHFTILGVLPDSVAGLCDVTDLYLAKWPVLPVGSRIFLRTVQQINGWEDLPKQTSSRVPAP